MDAAGERQFSHLRSIDSERAPIEFEEGRLLRRWTQITQDAAAATASDWPNYWNDDPSSLTCRTNIHGRILLATGNDIYMNIAARIAIADDEVILVTCFWARSKTLDAINVALRKLSAKKRPRDRKVRVRICFSSLSLWQKLFHTTSPQGHVYPPSEWVRKLGLPHPSELTGLDLEVKSIFFRPFSVLHPKFCMIDRKYVYLPSCNVSWENWLEASIIMTGNEINAQFTSFWKAVWASPADQSSKVYSTEIDVSTWVPNPIQVRTGNSSVPNNGIFEALSTLFLPSPHHRNPRFAFWPWQQCSEPPQTPLNNFLLAALAQASSSIYVQTPNLTSPPALAALLEALKRGVDVHITTSESLMLLEQLVTAGTTTSRCMTRLKKQHEQLLATYASRSDADGTLLEDGAFTKPGRLTIDFHEPKFDDNDPEEPHELEQEPLQSHMKLTVVDRRWTVLGSGNLDRASWFTSQELGVAFHSKDYAAHVMRYVETYMKTRRMEVYRSADVV